MQTVDKYDQSSDVLEGTNTRISKFQHGELFKMVGVRQALVNGCGLIN
jgi:hypothetical protein